MFTMQNFNLILSALIYGGGILFCISAVIYKRIKNFSEKRFSLVCLSCAVGAVLNLFLAMLLNQIPLWQFALICLAQIASFWGVYFMFRSTPTRLRQGVELSCGEEWINLSYLLTLIERAERFSLTDGEQEFVEEFKCKIRRMTSYYSYELPTGTQISRFYKICYRIGIV